MLVPIHLWANQSVMLETPSMVDVGGGTGRFMTFFRDNFPLADVSLVDLSPFMLEEAGKMDRYYKKFAKDNDKRIADGEFDIGDVKPLRLIQGNATSMVDITEFSHEIVTCSNMLSEMPAIDRMAAVHEFARITKPGGIVVVADVLQNGDVKGQDFLETLGKEYQPV